jgi:predicted ATPase
MITKIEALNFRCLRYISQPLDSFHILVGPNASGKTTFLDVISFISQLVSNGLESAINERTRNFQDLVWERSGNQFELAIEARVPEHIRTSLLSDRAFDTIRYELMIGLDVGSGQVGILEERVSIKKSEVQNKSEPVQRDFFPTLFSLPPTLLTSKGTPPRISYTVVNKVREGNDYFRTELLDESKKSWQYAFKLGIQKSALGNLPSDETQFPATTWLKNLLAEGVQPFVLNSLLIRRASPPGQGRRFKPDGSNLPWVIDDLYQRDRSRFQDWLAHLQTALPDIENIRTVEREDDRHRYLVVEYKGGLNVPSWLVSDGTLRLLALTLPAYLPNLQGIYLIEEPENGIHPRAVETVFQSMSSVYDAQILIASHSPVILGIAKPEQILCFAKTKEGSTDIVAGNLHPALQDWKGETNLGVLFASGVLG